MAVGSGASYRPVEGSFGLPHHGAIYVGQVTHTRNKPSRNRFSYNVYMAFVDVDQLSAKRFDYWPLFSSYSRYAITSLLNCDHMIHEDANSNLSARVRDFIERQSGERPTGRIFLLTNLCILGVEFNPISIFYVFNADKTTIDYVVAEVSNFPWLEQHPYLISPVRSLSTKNKRSNPQDLIPYTPTSKQFHVSPFMPVEGLQYRWCMSTPGETLRVRIAVHDDDSCLFFATFDTTRRPWTKINLLKMQCQFPLHSLFVMLAILYEAAKLFRRGFAFFPHPTGATSRLSCLVERSVEMLTSAKALVQSFVPWEKLTCFRSSRNS